MSKSKFISIIFFATLSFSFGADAADLTLPNKLSELNLFSNLPQMSPAPNVFSYRVNFPLWSDGAKKQRWVYLPPDSKINFQPDTPWLLPIGTVLIKQIDFDSRIETRIEKKTDQGWQFASYLWNTEQTDALRVDSATDVQVKTPFSSNKINWTVPANDQCLMCHISTAPDSEIIGFNTAQFGQNQLQEWMSKNRFLQASINVDQVQFLPDIMNTTGLQFSSTALARGYLAVNCSSCHRPGGFVPTSLDFSWSTHLDDMNAVGRNPLFGNLGVPNAKIIFPQSRSQSILWLRMTTSEQTHMPYFGSQIVDAEGLDWIGKWIDSLGD